MKLQVISDLHLEFDNRIERQGGAFFALPRTNADVILLAGDIWCRQADVY